MFPGPLWHSTVLISFIDRGNGNLFQQINNANNRKWKQSLNFYNKPNPNFFFDCPVSHNEIKTLQWCIFQCNLFLCCNSLCNSNSDSKEKLTRNPLHKNFSMRKRRDSLSKIESWHIRRLGVLMIRVHRYIEKKNNDICNWHISKIDRNENVKNQKYWRIKYFFILTSY